jgi:hypothetical protein
MTKMATSAMTTRTEPVDAKRDPGNGSPAPGSAASAAAEHGDPTEIAELRNRVKQLESRLAHQVTASKREQESLLKLVIGMAKGGYRFDPQPARSRTTKKIADDLLNAGVSLDEATILKHLRRASELLPAED